MEKRQLGQSDIIIPPLVFGGNVFGWSADEATSFRLLDQLTEAGLTAIDTADMYSVWADGHQGGESEAIIGRWLASRGGRDRSGGEPRYQASAIAADRERSGDQGHRSAPIAADRSGGAVRAIR